MSLSLCVSQGCPLSSTLLNPISRTLKSVGHIILPHQKYYDLFLKNSKKFNHSFSTPGTVTFKSIHKEWKKKNTRKQQELDCREIDIELNIFLLLDKTWSHQRHTILALNDLIKQKKKEKKTFPQQSCRLRAGGLEACRSVSLHPPPRPMLPCCLVSLIKTVQLPHDHE